MRDESPSLRRWVKPFAIFAWAVVGGGLIGPWVQALATEYGVFRSPTTQLSALARGVTAIMTHPHFVWPAGVCLGLLTGFALYPFWSRYVLREAEPVGSNSVEQAANARPRQPLPFPSIPLCALAISTAKVTADAAHDGTLTFVQCHLRVENKLAVKLQNCRIVVISVEVDQTRKRIKSALRVEHRDGKPAFTFDLAPKQSKSVLLFKGDLKDLIARQPPLMALAAGEYPLPPRSTYRVELELRSSAGKPTSVTLRLRIGEGKDVQVEVLSQTV